MRFFFRAVIFFLMCVSPIAFAGEPDVMASPVQAWNQHHGFYLEAGVGPNFFYAFLPESRSTAKVDGWGVALAAGYNFLPYVALEGGFIYSSDLNAYVEGDAAGILVSASEAAKIYIPYLAVRFSVPIGDRFAFIFKLGGMYPYASATIVGSLPAAGISVTGRISGDHALPFSGIGATYAVTRKIDVNIMYQSAVYVLASGAVLSFGATYHFD